MVLLKDSKINHQLGDADSLTHAIQRLKKLNSKIYQSEREDGYVVVIIVGK